MPKIAPQRLFKVLPMLKTLQSASNAQEHSKHLKNSPNLSKLQSPPFEATSTRQTLQHHSNPSNLSNPSNTSKLQSPHFSAVHLSPARRRVCTRMHACACFVCVCMRRALCICLCTRVHACACCLAAAPLAHPTRHSPLGTHSPTHPTRRDSPPASRRRALCSRRRALCPRPAATGLITPCALESRLARETRRMRQPSYPPGVPAAPPTAAERGEQSPVRVASTS
jgi:hypothetical protein